MRIPASIIKKEPLLRRVVIALGIAIAVGCVVRATIRVEGDFILHRETGRRFVANEFLYAGGTDFPYPPFFAMIFAPAALLPLPVAKAVYYSGGAAALLLLLWTMRRLVGSAFSLTRTQSFWVTAMAIFLTIQFIIRDQAVAGLNTVLVALTWLGVYLWRQSRDGLAGLSLGAAIAIKCMPIIFLGYFLWKRQWRVAICTAVAALVFTATPMVRQGPVFWAAHMKTWVGTAVEGIIGSGFESQENFRDRNMALRPVLIRYLVDTSPANGPLLHHSRSVNFVNLSPRIASWIVSAVLLSLLLIFMWWSRRPVVERDDPRLLWELAATGLLMTLFSPITWGQHCVALLPACYLIAARLITQDKQPNWIIIVLLFYVLFCSLSGRDLMGPDLWLWLVNYHVSTFCILGLFVLLLAGPEKSFGLTERKAERTLEITP